MLNNAEGIKTPLNLEILKGQLESFSNRVVDALSELRIYDAIHGLELDHVGMRVADVELIETLKAELAEAGECISAVNVNGREIDIFQMHEKFYIGNWAVRGVELPYPKEDHRYEDGWEHVEFVLEEAEDENGEMTMGSVKTAFFAKFPNLTEGVLRRDYEYKESEPEAERDQMPNPTISIRVGGVVLKFHGNSIQDVVGYKPELS